MLEQKKNTSSIHKASQVLNLLFALILLGSTMLNAQTNTETNSGIQFNFVVPGARSLALGGAFLARADDATAAYTNPAGLTALSRPELSVEGRGWSFNHIFTAGGRIDAGEPTGIGIDTISGIRRGEARNRVDGLSFLSFVHPASKRWRAAFYRHELANFEAVFDSQGNFRESPVGRNRPTRASADLYITNIGISAAVVALGNVYEPRLSLGIGISHYDFSMDFITQRFTIKPLGDSPATDPGGRYGPALFSIGNLEAEQIQRGKDSDLGLNIGFVWKIAKRWSLGGVYRQGPDFDLDAKQKGSPSRELQPILTDEPAEFHAPDVHGIGLAFTPRNSLRFSFDYNRVEYSRIVEGIVDIYGIALATNSQGINRGLDPELKRYKVDDASELHAGFEYVLFWGGKTRSPLALRLGAWLDPDHRIRFEVDCTDKTTALAQCYRFQSLYQPGDDEIHYSAGFGIADLPIGNKTKLQIDFAFDHSERIDTAAISAVFRFGQ